MRRSSIMSDRHPVMTQPTPLAEGVMGGDDSMTALPPLVEGQRLDQPTFHALYEAMPPGTRAELINGVVYTPSPVSLEHGVAHAPVIVWLFYYAERTPGLQVGDNVTAVLGRKSEPQPDALLRILPEFGGRTRVEKKMLHGVPELLVEVSHATRYVDLGPKLEDYQRADVLEYVVRALEPDQVFWFVREGGVLVERPIGEDGLYRSINFPGLWLDPQALVRGDGRRLRAVVDLGCATPEHAGFVARLAAARDRAQGQGPA
jgi:Uma2 family endonuclease